MAGKYPQTGSQLYDGNGKNITKTSLSTNIIIKVGTETIGAIQSIQITEERGIHMVDEVGTDGHIDSVPNRSTNITGSCTRVRFDRLRMAEAFSRGFTHVHAQRYPFDIEIIDVQNAPSLSADPSNDPATIVTVLRNVWIGNLNYTYQANDFVVQDQMQFQAETIASFFAGGNKNIARGGTRGIAGFQDAIELEADRGGRRGSLDAPGLINAFTGGVKPF